MPEKGLVRDLKKKPGQALFYDIEITPEFPIS